MGKKYDEYQDVISKIHAYDSHWASLKEFHQAIYAPDGIKANYLSLIGKAWEVQDDWIGEDRTSFMNTVRDIKEMLMEAVKEMEEGIKLTRKQANAERNELCDEAWAMADDFGIVDKIRYTVDGWE